MAEISEITSVDISEDTAGNGDSDSRLEALLIRHHEETTALLRRQAEAAEKSRKYALVRTIVTVVGVSALVILGIAGYIMVDKAIASLPTILDSVNSLLSGDITEILGEANTIAGGLADTVSDFRAVADLIKGLFGGA